MWVIMLGLTGLRGLRRLRGLRGLGIQNKGIIMVSHILGFLGMGWVWVWVWIGKTERFLIAIIN